MNDFFASGRAVDIVLAVIALEFVVLTLIGARSDALGPVALRTFLQLMPGACLLLALRAALTGAAWPIIALLLALSFPLHLLDTVWRARERKKQRAASEH